MIYRGPSLAPPRSPEAGMQRRKGAFSIKLEETSLTNGRTTDFSAGSISRHLLAFSGPMFLGNLLQAAYNTVDSFWVGRFLGADALAAVSVGFPIIFMLVSLVMGLTMAATTLTAQYAGARRQDMVTRVAGNSLGLLVISGAVLSALGVILHRPILSLINTPAAILPMAASYLSIYFSGLIFMFLYNAASAILRGLGDSLSPTVFLAYATGINIILDPLFIFGLGPLPALGVAGAAWATVLAQAVAAFLSLHHLARTNRLLQPKLSFYWPQAGLTWQTVLIGLPAGLQQVVVSLGSLVVTALVNSYGKTVMAAFGASARLDQFAFLPTLTISLATSALVGQNLGAGREERAHETLRRSAFLGAGISAGIALIVATVPRLLLSIFTDEPAVLAEGARYLRIVSLSYIPFSIMFAVNGFLRGAGDTIPTLLNSAGSLWLIRLPLSYWLSRWVGLGTTGIWIGMAASPVAGLLLSYLYYRTGRWRAKVVARPETPCE